MCAGIKRRFYHLWVSLSVTQVYHSHTHQHTYTAAVQTVEQVTPFIEYIQNIQNGTPDDGTPRYRHDTALADSGTASNNGDIKMYYF